MPDNYTLSGLSKEHLATISYACELLSRISMGQFDMIGDLVPSERSVEEVVYLRDQFRYLEPVFTGLPPNGHLGISNPKIRNEARLAFDVHQLIRQTLSFERKKDGSWGVDRDNPMVYDGKPLPKLGRVDEDTKPEDRVIEMLSAVWGVASDELRNQLVMAEVCRPDGTLHPKHRSQPELTDEAVKSCIMSCCYPGNTATAEEILDWCRQTYDQIDAKRVNYLMGLLVTERKIVPAQDGRWQRWQY